MRNVHEVLQQKEMELARVRQEVDALRCVAPLLSEPRSDPREVTAAEAGARNRWPLRIEEAPPSSFGQ